MEDHLISEDEEDTTPEGSHWSTGHLDDNVMHFQQSADLPETIEGKEIKRDFPQQCQTDNFQLKQVVAANTPDMQIQKVTDQPKQVVTTNNLDMRILTITEQPHTMITSNYPSQQVPTANMNEKDALLPAVLVTLFCCWLFGIIAIVTAVKSRNAFKKGDFERWTQKYNSAWDWIKASLIFGIFNIVGYVISKIVTIVIGN